MAWEDFFAWRAFELGTTLLGMRVADLLSTVRRVSEEHRLVFAVGLEAGGLVVLHAAALDSSIAGVATSRTLRSYQDVMENPRYEEPTSSFVPGALSSYDLPDLAKAIQPRPYVAVDAFNALRRPAADASPMPAQAAARVILKGLGL